MSGVYNYFAQQLHCMVCISGNMVNMLYFAKHRHMIDDLKDLHVR